MKWTGKSRVGKVPSILAYSINSLVWRESVPLDPGYLMLGTKYPNRLVSLQGTSMVNINRLASSQGALPEF